MKFAIFLCFRSGLMVRLKGESGIMRISPACRSVLAAGAVCLCANTGVRAAGPMQPLNHIPESSVHLTGRLGQRYSPTASYLIALHDRTIPAASFDMLHPFQHRDEPHEQGWDGEYAGKWLDAASLIRANTNDAVLASRINPFAQTLRSTQLRNGYMGISLIPNGEWDLWNMWYVMHGMLSHYEDQGDPSSLQCAAGTGAYITGQYLPPGNSYSIFSGAWGSGINVMDQLLRLHGHSGEPALMELSAHIAANSLAYNLMRQTHSIFLSHSYVVSGYLGAMTEFAVATGSADDFIWLEAVWQDVVDRHLFHTYGIGEGEVFWNPWDYWPYASKQETCATVEWITWTQRLYEATGDVRYAHQIENTIYNALLAAQAVDGMKWMYYTPMDGGTRQWFSGPTKCCYWSGPRGIARLPGHLYHTDADGLRVDLYEASTASGIMINGVAVEVTQETDYPAHGQIHLTINPNVQVSFQLKLRLPVWAQNISMTVNGLPARVPLVAGQYAVIDRPWNPGDQVQLTMTMAVTIQSRPVMVNFTGVAVQRGPEVLSLDSRDNPGLTFANVTWYANPLLVELPPIDGRRRYRCRVLIGQKPGQVVLTPFADAGNDGATYRTLWPISNLPTPLQPGDVNADGQVNIDDLVEVITAWGACPPPPTGCPADVAPAAGVVDIDDLVMVITHWG